jgi:hypothetical protein
VKAFRFSLEQVRSWRLEQAELEELKLQKIHQAARSVLGGARIEADALAGLDSFREHSRGKLKKIAEQTKDCRQRADTQRQKLIEMRRQFELLDRLKKKAMAEWIHARDKEQEEVAAELFLAKRTRDRD